MNDRNGRELAVGQGVIVHGHGRLRGGVVEKVGRSRATVRIEIPTTGNVYRKADSAGDVIAFGLRVLNGAAEKVAIRDATRFAEQVNDRSLERRRMHEGTRYERFTRRATLPGAQELLDRAAEAVKELREEDV